MSLEGSLDVIREFDLSVLLMMVGFDMIQVQVLKSGRRVEVDQVGNAFCPTGKGGGVDPTCGKGGKGARSEGGLSGSIKKNWEGSNLFSDASSVSSISNASKDEIRALVDFKRGATSKPDTRRQVDSLISKSHIVADGTVYRGMKMKILKEGERITGMSWTTSSRVAVGFSGAELVKEYPAMSNHTLLVMDVKKGDSGLVVKGLKGKYAEQEQEVLFPSTQKFKVVKVETIKHPAIGTPVNVAHVKRIGSSRK